MCITVIITPIIMADIAKPLPLRFLFFDSWDSAAIPAMSPITEKRGIKNTRLNIKAAIARPEYFFVPRDSFVI